jgi:hypothetical protein
MQIQINILVHLVMFGDRVQFGHHTAHLINKGLGLFVKISLSIQCIWLEISNAILFNRLIPIKKARVLFHFFSLAQLAYSQKFASMKIFPKLTYFP